MAAVAVFEISEWFSSEDIGAAMKFLYEAAQSMTNRPLWHV